MTQVRNLTDRSWKILQFSHHRWWWTDQDGRVSLFSYPTKQEAELARDIAKESYKENQK